MAKNRKMLAYSLLFAQHNELFVCPVCSGSMIFDSAMRFVCERSHCFDLSRAGYINLYPHPSRSKYDQALFLSRRTVYNSGIFAPLWTRISDIIPRQPLSARKEIRILDAGCGEGSHLHHIRQTLLDHTPFDVLGAGIDLAKEGIQAAAKAYSDLLWCVGDIAGCPLASHQFDVILNILSPANYSEYKRMLASSGQVIKVIPGEHYLQPLRRLLHNKTNTQTYSSQLVVDKFKSQFRRTRTDRLHYSFSLDSGLIEDLLQMTPLSWRATEEQKQRIMHNSMQSAALELTVDLIILTGEK